MIVTVHGQQVGVLRLGDGSVRISSPAAVITLHRVQAMALAFAIKRVAEDAQEAT